jgi:hypothetical protein
MYLLLTLQVAAADDLDLFDSAFENKNFFMSPENRMS